MKPQDGWGGRRTGAGRKPGWKAGPCKAVKLPVALIDQVLAYARQLDTGAHDHGPQLEPIPPVAPPGDRWAQVAKLVDEKAELQRRLEHQAELLAGERRQRQLEDQVNQALRARIDDARSVLQAAYDEYHRGVRKGIRPADAPSAIRPRRRDRAWSPSSKSWLCAAPWSWLWSWSW